MRRGSFVSGLSVTAGVLASLSFHTSADAGTTFRFDRAQAAPGETVGIVAVYYNDTEAAADWTPADRLVLQWRSARGDTVRTLAYKTGEALPVSVPVNNFVEVQWQAVVPPEVEGLQAVSIEGEPTLLALDTSPLEQGPIAGTPAAGPIVDAGEPRGRPGTGEPLPPVVTSGLGVEPTAGAAPNEAGAPGRESYSSAAWNHFRNALSPYEPIYFVVGTRDGVNARFQISLKYRLFQPPLNSVPAFHERLYVGYTQTSVWDLDSPSKPFYDTTYNPSLFWLSDSVWESAGKRWGLGLMAGVDHMSNGRDGDESRSFNSVFVQPAFRYRFDGGSTLSFTPKIRGYFGVDSINHDVATYRGYVDWGLRWARDDGVLLAGQFRQGRSGHTGVQVDLAWPLRHTWLRNLNGYLHFQYAKGYGQTLLNYNSREPGQFRVGLMLVH